MIHLVADGLWCGRVENRFGARTLLIDGPNAGEGAPQSTGKTTRLRLIEFAIRGYVPAWGKFAGEVCRLARDRGEIQYSIDVEGARAVGKVKLTNRQAPRVEGCAVEMLELPLDGSPEATRRWLAGALRPPAGVTPTSAWQSYCGGKVPPFAQPVAADALGFANLLDAAAREHRNTVASKLDTLRTTLAGHTVTAPEATMAGSVAELTERHAAAVATLERIKLEYGNAFRERERRASIEARIQDAQQAIDACSVESSANDAEVLARDIATCERALADATAEVFNAETAERNATDAANTAKSQWASAQATSAIMASRVSEHVKHSDVIKGGKCPTCGRDFEKGDICDITEVLAEFDKAKCEESRMRSVATELAIAHANAVDRHRKAIREEYAVREALAQAKSNLKDFQERTEMVRSELLEATRARDAAQRELDAMGPAPDDLTMRLDIDRAAAEVDTYARGLAAAQERAAAANHAIAIRAQIADLETKKTEADAWLKAAIALRAEILTASTKPLAQALDLAASVVDASPLIDLAEKDPALGFTRNGHRIELSGRESVTFRAALAAALLAQSPAPEARRVLLVEADPVPVEMLPMLLDALNAADVGHIIVAKAGEIVRPLVPSPWEIVEVAR